MLFIFVLLLLEVVISIYLSSMVCTKSRNTIINDSRRTDRYPCAEALEHTLSEEKVRHNVRIYVLNCLWFNEQYR